MPKTANPKTEVSERKGKEIGKKAQRMEKKGENGAEGEEKKEGNPVVESSSPYTKQNDLEDYKRKAYGSEGQLQPRRCRFHRRSHNRF